MCTTQTKSTYKMWIFFGFAILCVRNTNKDIDGQSTWNFTGFEISLLVLTYSKLLIETLEHISQPVLVFLLLTLNM